jgi:hypothetical protein
MAIQIKKVTGSDKLLKIISVLDSAIDWDKSFSQGNDDYTLEDKQKLYEKDHEISRLVFLTEIDHVTGQTVDLKPTMFIFNHPLKVEISRKIRSVWSNNLARGVSGKSDLFTDIFNVAYMGTEEGLDGGILELAPRRDGVITDAYMQGLEDSGVFEELSTAIISVINKKPSLDAKKK